MRRAHLLAAFGTGFAIGIQLLFVNATVARVVDEARVSPDPIALYGQEIYFDVRRDGQTVGAHKVHFERNGSLLTVSSDFQLQIDVLFVTVFRYRYQSVEEWRGGLLDRLTVQVDDDGTPLALEAERKGSWVDVRSDKDTFGVDAPLYPTNHWNAGVLGESRVLNTLTGRVNSVIIRPAGRETVPTERGQVMATRYAYTGELETEVWYDDAGRWVKMRFAGRDGSIIEYACRRCQGGDVKEAQR